MIYVIFRMYANFNYKVNLKNLEGRGEGGREGWRGRDLGDLLIKCSVWTSFGSWCEQLILKVYFETFREKLGIFGLGIKIGLSIKKIQLKYLKLQLFHLRKKKA